MDRTQWELALLIKLLKKQPYFKKQELLKDSFYKSLTYEMKIINLKDGEKVYQKFNDSKHFFIIVRGEVKLTKKNESIDKWQWAYNLYQSLITWKEK